MAIKRDGDGTGPDSNDPPIKVPPKLGSPDIEFVLAQCIPHAIEQRLEAGLEALIATKGAAARGACIGGRQRVGLWIEPAPFSDAHRLHEFLGAIRLLHADEQGQHFAIRITDDFIIKQASKAFEASPGHIVESGVGIDLVTFDVTFRAPDEITSTVFAEAKVAGVTEQFSVVITDRLRLSHGTIKNTSSNRVEMSSGTALDIALAKVFLFSTGILADLAERINIPSSLELTQATLGDAIVAVLPREVLLPDTSEKLILTYERLMVSSTGVTVAGTLETAVRRPHVSIASVDASVLGTHATHSVNATIVDADGASAHASATVNIKVVGEKPDHSDGSHLPPSPPAHPARQHQRV